MKKKQYRKNRVLITGGAGFIGSHLCENFLEKKWEVICLDNFFTGSKENVAHLMNHPTFEMVRHDVTQPYFCEVELILNFACPASPVHYQHDPIKTLQTNVVGTMNMLELAKRTGARILQASTSEVYGNPKVHPQTETYWGNVNPIGVRSCYDEGKRAAETLCFDYHRQHHVDIKMVRIFNTYGPHMALDDGRVVSNFIVQALRGENITIYGEGKQTRSFCFVEDLVKIISLFAESENNFTGPMNIGNDREFTMIELANLVTQLTQSKSKIIHMPLPQDDPEVRRPDLTVAKSTFAWEPRVHLEEGIKRSIPYFKSKLGL